MATASQPPVTGVPVDKIVSNVNWSSIKMALSPSPGVVALWKFVSIFCLSSIQLLFLAAKWPSFYILHLQLFFKSKVHEQKYYFLQRKS